VKFPGNEQGGRVGEGSFQTQIFFEDVDNFLRQGQDALLVSFAEHPQLCLGQAEILQLESQDFAGSASHQATSGSPLRLLSDALRRPHPLRKAVVEYCATSGCTPTRGVDNVLQRSERREERRRI
jgi:hypothetical protein